jgi:Flp pilus assembly protein TadG
MLRYLKSALPLREFLGNRRGNILIMFAGTAAALVLLVGGGVDYSRAVQFKTSLQSVADAAALAGASAYVSTTTSALGVTTASNYFTAGVAKLPPNNGASLTGGTPIATSDASGYYIQVSATGSIRTTFLSMFTSTLTVTVNAKAKDPIVTAHVDFSGWTTSAYDGNTIYWYAVPPDNSLPTFDTTHANQSGFNTAFSAVFTNIQNNPPTTNTTFSIAAAQQIGFAFVNITGGRCPSNSCSPVTNYGSNGYGGQFNSVHVFFSQLTTQANNSASNSTYGYPSPSANGHPTNCNATLLVVQTDPNNPTQAAPSANTGSCQSWATPQPLASPSCAQLNGVKYRYYWNDMGAGNDDFDFNDGVYNFNCTVNGLPTTGVILIN